MASCPLCGGAARGLAAWSSVEEERGTVGSHFSRVPHLASAMLLSRVFLPGVSCALLGHLAAQDGSLGLGHLRMVLPCGGICESPTLV